MRAFLAPLLLLALAAGCLDSDGGPAPAASTGPAASTPAATAPTPTSATPATPTPTSAPPANGSVSVPLRSLDAGTRSEIPYPFRLVINDSEEWRTFWEAHRKKTYEGSGEPRAAPPPTVDFTKERVAAVALGDKPNGCWAVRVGNATDEGAITTLVVTTYRPPPERMCTMEVTQPYHFVAIPADGTEVAWRETETAGEPPAAGNA